MNGRSQSTVDYANLDVIVVCPSTKPHGRKNKRRRRRSREIWKTNSSYIDACGPMFIYFPKRLYSERIRTWSSDGLFFCVIFLTSIHFLPPVFLFFVWLFPFMTPYDLRWKIFLLRRKNVDVVRQRLRLTLGCCHRRERERES